MVCDSLNAIGAKVNKSIGLHVHFDASKISDSHLQG
ncbi:amidoligase family protein [Bacteroides finegoldii]